MNSCYHNLRVGDVILTRGDQYGYLWKDSDRADRFCEFLISKYEDGRYHIQDSCDAHWIESNWFRVFAVKVRKDRQ